MFNFAKVVDNKVTNTYRSDKQYVDDNGVRFPQSIWQNDAFLKSQNIYTIIDSTMPNEILYTIGNQILSYDTKADKVLRSYTKTEKSNTELKSYFNQVNLEQFKLMLEPTNYHLIRKQEDSNYTIPEAVTEWRKTIYSEFDAHAKNISACDSISKFADLKIVFTQQPDDVI